VVAEPGSRQTIDKTKELKQKLAEDYENQPKVIGALTLDEGRGFVIDPVTVLALPCCVPTRPQRDLMALRVHRVKESQPTVLEISSATAQRA
jgi:hypothetical protein